MAAGKRETAVKGEVPREWALRRYRTGDEHALVALFNAEFGKQRSLTHWHWQFRDNPYGGPFVVVAERRSDGMLVGSHSSMPFPLNVLGRRMVGGHTLDLVMHHAYRRQGIFEQAGSACMEWLGEQGVAAVIAFPNASSYPGFIRSLGWHRLAVPRIYGMRLGLRSGASRGLARTAARLLDPALRLGSRSVLARAALNLPRATRGVGLAVADCVPEQYDLLWERWRSQEVLSLWKDRQYLHWRYEDNPDHRFEFAWLEHDGAMTVFAVFTRIGARMQICEMLPAEPGSRWLRALTLELANLALGRGLDSISFMGWDAGRYDEAFAGFTSHVAHQNVVVGRVLDGGAGFAERFVIPQNWSIAFGDADFV